MPRPADQLKADFFKALGHPARVRVLLLLRDGERSVAEMLPQVGLEQSHLSQQLGVLRRAGVVRSRKEGSNVVYEVIDPRIYQLLHTAKEIVASSLTRSGEMLADLADLADLDVGTTASQPGEPS